MTRRYPLHKSITVDVDVSIEEFATSDLIDELNRRQGSGESLIPEDAITLTASRHDINRIRGWIYAGKYEQACREMGDLIRDALGTAI